MVLRKITVKKPKKTMGCRHAILPELCLLNACYAICTLHRMASVKFLLKLSQHGGMVRMSGQDICGIPT